jgi:hypothetical protein
MKIYKLNTNTAGKKNLKTKKHIQNNKSNTKSFIKHYEPIYTIIEPYDKSKRILDFTLLRKMLKKYGLKECKQYECMKRNVLFVWLNYDENSLHSLKRKYYTTPIYLENSLTNMESISNKDKLHLNIKQYFPKIYNKHIAQSFLLKPNWKYTNSNDIFIARPINILVEKRERGVQGIGYGGKDIIIIHNQQTLKQAQSLLHKYDNVLISEYITKPLLFRGYKCHIRTYLLASIINNSFHSYMIDFGRIFTAKLPYNNADWNNSDIHDTHMKSTPTDWFFPKDFTNDNINRSDITITKQTIQHIFTQIKTILSTVSKLLSKTVSLYDNVKNGFNIFGIDLMIKDDFTVILIECNAEGTYKSKEPTTHTIIENIMFNWVNDVILKPCLRELQVNTNTKNYKKHKKHKTMKKTM